MTRLLDFHSHHLDAPAGSAIVNLPLEVLSGATPFAPLPHARYSVGIHPWWSSLPPAELAQLQQQLPLWAARDEVVALGECGFDRLRGDWAVQEQLFPLHVRLSEAYGKPLILHCVRAFDRLLALRKHYRPTQRWVIHGFRGRPALARQLLQADFDLSFGEHYNAESYALTPPSRRHIESDEGRLPAALLSTPTIERPEGFNEEV